MLSVLFVGESELLALVKAVAQLQSNDNANGPLRTRNGRVKSMPE